MPRNFRYRCAAGDEMRCAFFSAAQSAASSAAKAASLSVCAPPAGSGTTPSMTPSASRSCAVSFITPHASCARDASFHKIEANPSGESTLYTAFSIISTTLPMPSASAPPLPPSPVITATSGTVSSLITARHPAMASPCPCASASRPGYAPGVSMNVTTGRPNFSAARISRWALR